MCDEYINIMKREKVYARQSNAVERDQIYHKTLLIGVN